MSILPDLSIGLLNGWIPLGLYFGGLLISVSLYSKESRTWLFNNPKNTRKRILLFIRLLGQFSMMAFIILMIFTPLRVGTPEFFVGVIVFGLGLVMEMSALYFFRKTPIGQPVVNGPYRFSRNPQWLGLFFTLLGSAIAAGVWLYIGIVIGVGMIYHIQILDEEKACLEEYGEGYREYMNRIPRYLIF